MADFGFLRLTSFLRIMRSVRTVEEAPLFIPNASGSVNVWDLVRPMQLYSDWSTETSGEYTAEANPLYFDVATDKYKLTSETHAPYTVWAPVSERNASTLVPTAAPPGVEDSLGWFIYRGRWELISIQQMGNVGFISTEDHPGTGVAFTINVGAWDSSSHDWGYDTETEYYAIDNRVGIPLPASGATGLGIWRASVTHGRILEVVAMDCTGDEPL
jgi:hypothetical protein